ncbi:MAG: BatA domain-containing protein, partial [Ferruginibacter sp.]|nr:BatA domain-containing protein [Ferruginibacter sp.]
MKLPFEYTFLLWLLLILPFLIGIYFYAKQQKKSAFKKIGDQALVKELTSHYIPSSFAKKFLFVLFSMALILISLANFRSPQGSSQIKRNGIDVMIAIDVSKSMLAQDISPNRLD